MTISKMCYMLIGIVLYNTACLKRVAVNPGSERIAASDFVEVTLKSGKTFVLKDVKVHSDYLKGKHRDKIIQIRFEQIETIEVVNRDYGKALTYYIIGSAIAIVIVLLLAQSVPTT